MWNDFYNDPDHMKKGFFVAPKFMNMDHFNHYINADFRYIDDALKQMDVLDRVCLGLDLVLLPYAIHQLHAIVFFYSDPARTTTSMTDKEPFLATF
jgi:hypothetical protein